MSDKKFNIGDSAVVKPDVHDPDMGGDMGGWQGRICEIRTPDDDKSTVSIEWDSITLNNIPESVIVHCELEGLDWSVMGLFADEVTKIASRDTKADVERIKARLAQQYRWISIGNDEAQGRRIQAVLNSAKRSDEMGAFEAWEQHLKANLKLPFKAEVYESQEHGPIRSGDRVTVLDFDDYLDDLRGIIVDIKHKRGHFSFPLCDLIPVDEASENHQHSHDYNVWFANR